MRYIEEFVLDNFLASQLDLTNAAVQDLLRLVATINDDSLKKCVEINTTWIDASTKLIDTLEEKVK